MKLELITELVKNYDKSKKFRIGFYSNPKRLKAYESMDIRKYTEITGRIGINYYDLESVKEKMKSENYVKKETAQNKEWLVENKIQKNVNTGTVSLVFFPDAECSDAKSKITVIDGEMCKDITRDELVTYCGSSQKLRENVAKPELININISNIYMFDTVGKSVIEE